MKLKWKKQKSRYPVMVLPQCSAGKEGLETVYPSTYMHEIIAFKTPPAALWLHPWLPPRQQVTKQ